MVNNCLQSVKDQEGGKGKPKQDANARDDGHPFFAGVLFGQPWLLHLTFAYTARVEVFGVLLLEMGMDGGG